MLTLLAPGIAKMKLNHTFSGADTCLHDTVDPGAWRDAMVFDYRKMEEVLDTNYRQAKAIGHYQASTLIHAFEDAAKSVAWPYITSIASFYDALVLSGSQIVRYQEGGFFKPHRDSGKEYRNRCFTILCYLTDCIGGETIFPEYGVHVTPEPGAWLVFYSEYLHESRPVLGGEKSIFVTWACKV